MSQFADRHIGPCATEVDLMLEKIGATSLDDLIYQAVPDGIRLKEELNLSPALSEQEYMQRIRGIASKNKVFKTYIGMGYYDTISPSVIIRNVLENPVWYTSYTPYQAEISQGRLEALLNFQTMVSELTGMALANASLLDEATAAAEAMIMMFNTRSRSQAKAGVNTCFVDAVVWPQTKTVLETRATPLGINLEFGEAGKDSFDSEKHFGAIVQFPDANGEIRDFSAFAGEVHNAGGKLAVGADLLSLSIISPPGEWGADIVFGSSQRFGVPLYYGGPHAAFFAAGEEFKRHMPGRIIGVSKDATGKPALRMALQTREQHIKRERATSNICTAQALLATMAGFYGVWHGADGLKEIASKIHGLATRLNEALDSKGFKALNKTYFDTLRFKLPESIVVDELRAMMLEKGINLRYFEDSTLIGISIDETTSEEDVQDLIDILLHVADQTSVNIHDIKGNEGIPAEMKRKSKFMEQEVFNNCRSETEMMRYIKRLERKDISLAHSMISLGSCTMKLNAASELFSLTWPEFTSIHPFVPVDQARGYHEMMDELRADLAEITGLADVSLQPNSGAAGEYAGLMVIRTYHQSRNEGHRNVALIPSSAHGTNPASAVMAGMKVVVVKCDEMGNIDMNDLREKAEKHSKELSCIMVTYPSTHGVFESSIKELCNVIHHHGGQVYMDGANMNAQVGITSPGLIGADVCHLNLHKTFSIPHGGGGPGVGPIAVASHLAVFLPGHAVIDNMRDGISAVAAAPWGSPGVLPITYGYIKMMGAGGLKKATQVAILNANYLAVELKDDYGILYTGESGRVGHEMILECRKLKAATGISEIDIAKRLIDYGYHAPTVSFPVHGTLMIEPTESESKEEMDRFLDALKAIYAEIKEVEAGIADKADNVLKNAPHPDYVVVTDAWERPYGREKAAFPLAWVRENKFWPAIARVDDAYGDRNLVCTCEPLENYQDN
ncbi:aminomethyl-transferring glycine dehydrogenase [Marinilabilia rubra]|uniref:Glycine dehydrogenase (decarboxylating) n=1 Tax=Marinilabilia rubra TaxID=2162893 RepID=A0A2U2B8C1_9BACT|nr:aminomethyl-transferring glycine dehydrogenase [Marinilabilia rubra]PWD99293.1 glycine dehydrogenase (aminomethyl-transferring) [Marinilabilia rubra]